MTDQQNAENKQQCGPCSRGQHGVCDGGFYNRCDCTWPGRNAELAEVLAAHQWSHTATTHCACGFRTPLAQLAVEGYLAHFAEQIERIVALRLAKVEALAEEWDRTGREGLPHLGCLDMYRHCAAELRRVMKEADRG